MSRPTLKACGLIALLALLLSAQTETYTIDTIAGIGLAPVSGAGGPADQATLVEPDGVAIAPNGDVYIADSYYRRIFKIDADGRFSVAVGSGEAGSCADGGTALDVGLMRPTKLDVDSNGVLYFVDEALGAVCRMMPDGAIDVAVPLGASAIVVDGDDNLVVARGNTIFRLPVTSGEVTHLGGTGAPGSTGDGGMATDATFLFITGLAYDAQGNLYVADIAARNVRVIGPDGMIERFAGTGALGERGVGGPAVRAQFGQPIAVDVRPNGVVVIADFLSSRVLQVTLDGVLLELFSQADIAELSGINDFKIHPDRDFVGTTENALVIQGSRPQNARILAGTVRSPAFGEGGPANRAALLQPTGVVANAAGDVFVADQLGRRVRVIEAETGAIRTHAGNGDFDIAGNDGPARSAGAGLSVALAISDVGEVFLTHRIGSGVRKVELDGDIVQVAGGTRIGFGGDGGPALDALFAGPEGIAFDNEGQLWIADTQNHRVRRVGQDGGVDTMAGTGIPGLGGIGGPAVDAQLASPTGVAMNSRGEVFIVERRRIVRIALNGNLETVLFFPPEAGRLGFHGISVGPDDNLYVTDILANVIVKISAAGDTLQVIAGRPGMSGFDGDGGPALEALLGAPSDIFVNDAGTVYFSDQDNGRVRMLEKQIEVEPPPAVNAASFEGRVAAPGLILTVFALDIGPDQAMQARLDEEGRIADELGGVQAFFDEIPGRVIFVSKNQISIIVPYGVAGRESVTLRLELDGQETLQGVMPVVEANPGIFSVAGTSRAVVVNQDGSINSPENAAKTGSIVVLFVTGEGQTDPPGQDGLLATEVFPAPVLPVRVEIDGVEAEVLYGGAAPTFTAGLMQLNIRIPAGITVGPETTIRVFLGDFGSQEGSTFATMAP